MNDVLNKNHYDGIAVGDRASFSMLITSELIDEFAKVSGDINPLHMDEVYAEGTIFKQRIAHGMIIGSFFSQLIGMHLPGENSLYLSQTLRFHRPAFIGSKIIISGEVIHKTDVAKTVTIRTMAEDSDSGQLLVSGEAMVQLLK